MDMLDHPLHHQVRGEGGEVLYRLCRNGVDTKDFVEKKKKNVSYVVFSKFKYLVN